MPLPSTYTSAVRKNENVLQELEYIPATKKHFNDLWAHRESIEALVRYYLRLKAEDSCIVLDPRAWMQGAFNVCVLVEVASGGVTTRFVFRCPKPYRLVGIMDEKSRSEVGAYVHIQEECPNIRIPHLFGFGFLDGYKFMHVMHQPFYIRIFHALRRSIYSLFRLPALSQYTRISTAPSINTPYMLLEYVGSDSLQMLSKTLDKHMTNPENRQRLFHGLAQIMLSLARIPQSRIGSFRFSNDGTVALTNRYLSCSLAIIENENTSRSIRRDKPHSCTDSFISDLLTLHSGRFNAQPNAVLDENDCRGQMAIMLLLRAISHHHTKQQYRQGPYLLSLTDMNPSNILVDEDGNIKVIFDMEWLCTVPPEALHVPHWLTGCNIEDITDEKYNQYNQVRQEFMLVLEQEEGKARMEHNILVSKVMEEMWNSKGVWFWHCLTSVDAMNCLFEDHLCPKGYLPSNVEQAISEFWCNDVAKVVKKKVAERMEYEKLLQSRFPE